MVALASEEVYRFDRFILDPRAWGFALGGGRGDRAPSEGVHASAPAGRERRTSTGPRYHHAGGMVRRHYHG